MHIMQGSQYIDFDTFYCVPFPGIWFAAQCEEMNFVSVIWATAGIMLGPAVCETACSLSTAIVVSL